MSAVFVEDIGKDARDLLSQDFPSEGVVKFTTQTKTIEGFTLKSTLNRAVKKDKSIVREVVGAAFEPKLDINSNLEVSGKITSNREVTGTIAARDILGAGTKLEVSVLASGDSIAASPTLTYKNHNVAVKSKITYPIAGKSSDVKLTADVGFYTSDFHGGIGASVVTDPTNTLILLDGVASYTVKKSQFLARAVHGVGTDRVSLGLSVLHHYDLFTKIAGDVQTDTTLERINVSAGGEYRVDRSTTLKGKVVYKQNKKDTDLRTALALKQQISPSLLATVGTDLNTRAFFGNETGEPHSFGVEFKLTGP